MKTKILIALLSLSLLSPIIASAQLITTSQTTTTTKSIEKPKKAPKKLAPIGRGFEHSVEFAYRTATYDYSGAGGINYTLGYRFGNYFFLGGGVGLNFQHQYSRYNTIIGIPLYLQGKVYFTKTRCQPYLSLSTGVYLSSPCAYFINPMIGVNYRITNTVSLYFAMGYNHETAEYNYPYDNQISQIKFSLGCTFTTADVKKVVNDVKNLVTD